MSSFYSGLTLTRIPAGEETEPKSSAEFNTWNMVSPYLSQEYRAIEPQGTIDVRVEERGKSECRPVIGRRGVATSPYVKTGRLPYGLSSQENRQNFINGRKANGAT